MTRYEIIEADEIVMNRGQVTWLTRGPNMGQYDSANQTK